MEIRRRTATAVKSVLKQRRFKIFERPYELNIVGIRSPNTTPNKFDDRIFVFFNDKDGHSVFYGWQATTDPGTYWLRQPMQPQGTGILAEGQYINAYEIGLHLGQYNALVQRGAPVTILRDYNRDAVLDFNNGKRESGFFGINIHRASAVGTTKIVDRYSAGCQVFSNVEDFNFFMTLCEKHRELYENRFTYTLIDLRAVRRAARLRSVLIGGSLTAGLLGLVGLFFINEKK